jgi:hypothetical protein
MNNTFAISMNDMRIIKFSARLVWSSGQSFRFATVSHQKGDVMTPTALETPKAVDISFLSDVPPPTTLCQVARESAFVFDRLVTHSGSAPAARFRLQAEHGVMGDAQVLQLLRALGPTAPWGGVRKLSAAELI